MNMNPGRFYIPSYIGMRSVPMSNAMMGISNSTPMGVGLFSRITNSIRSVNWSGLLTNANKTLNVVNQAIPLVRQAGPMVNNMKSMLRIAKAFGSETATNNRRPMNNNIRQTNNSSNFSSYSDKNLSTKKEEQNYSAPNFFV